MQISFSSRFVTTAAEEIQDEISVLLFFRLQGVKLSTQVTQLSRGLTLI